MRISLLGRGIGPGRAGPEAAVAARRAAFARFAQVRRQDVLQRFESSVGCPGVKYDCYAARRRTTRRCQNDAFMFGNEVDMQS